MFENINDLLKKLMELLKNPKENMPAVIRLLITLPGARIDREEFLKTELSKCCDEQTVQKAIEFTPQKAGVKASDIDKIANSCIKFETVKVTAISAASGVPGGFAMFATVPGDIIQFYIHVLRIIQKLAYLYGWCEISKKEEIDDATAVKILIFMGVMFGISSAAKLLKSFIPAMTKSVAAKISSKALTQGTIYPIVKNVAGSVGAKMSKQLFGRGVSKIVPLAGALISGGLTYFTFIKCAKRLKLHFSLLPCANPDDNTELGDN